MISFVMILTPWATSKALALPPYGSAVDVHPTQKTHATNEKKKSRFSHPGQHAKPLNYFLPNGGVGNVHPANETYYKK